MHFAPLSRLAHLFAGVLVFGGLLAGCDTGEPGPPESPDFVTEPTNALDQRFDDAPDDATWDWNAFNNDVEVRLDSDTEWEGEVVLRAFQVQNGEVVNRLTTEPVPAPDRTEGTTTEELYPGTKWFSGERWIPGTT